MMTGLLDEPLALTLVAPDGSDLAALPIPPANFVPYRFGHLHFLHAYVSETFGELRRLNVTLLHALDAQALEIASRLAARGLDYVLSVDDLLEDQRPPGRQCRALLAESLPIQEMLLRRRLVRPQQVHLLRPGVYQARHTPPSGQPQRLLAVMATGRYCPPEAFLTALQAFALLRSQRDDCAFFLADSPEMDHLLRQRAQKLGLLGDLTFVDRQGQEQLDDIFRSADVLVSPSACNRIDLELLSAMAAGVPVVAEGPGVNDFIIPDKTALTFPPGDAAQLAGRLAALLNDRALADGLCANALAHLRENHSPARMVSQLAGLYRSLSQPAPAGTLPAD
jgi:glycosyltransferase involved in cell wall biosynthesis